MYLSSAKKPIFDETTRGKSLMYMKNNTGPNRDPCGTSDVTWATEDITPSPTMYWVRFFITFSVHLRFLLQLS